jgi:hypothetical protein
MPVLRVVVRCALACALLAMAGEARAEWPCGENTRYRVARSVKGGKPIAIGAAKDPKDKPIYGAFTFVELNNDGRQDIVFESACIRGPGDSVKLHRVYASCGKAADGVEDFVMIFEAEELCARTVKIETQAAQTKASEVLWQDLQLVRTVREGGKGGGTCEQTAEALRFDGAQYKAGPRASKACPRP